MYGEQCSQESEKAPFTWKESSLCSQRPGATGWFFSLLPGDLVVLANAGGFVSCEHFKDFVISDVDTRVRSNLINLLRK